MGKLARRKLPARTPLKLLDALNAQHQRRPQTTGATLPILVAPQVRQMPGEGVSPSPASCPRTPSMAEGVSPNPMLAEAEVPTNHNESAGHSANQEMVRKTQAIGRTLTLVALSDFCERTARETSDSLSGDCMSVGGMHHTTQCTVCLTGAGYLTKFSSCCQRSSKHAKCVVSGPAQGQATQVTLRSRTPSTNKLK